MDDDDRDTPSSRDEADRDITENGSDDDLSNDLSNDDSSDDNPPRSTTPPPPVKHHPKTNHSMPPTPLNITHKATSNLTQIGTGTPGIFHGLNMTGWQHDPKSFKIMILSAGVILFILFMFLLFCCCLSIMSPRTIVKKKRRRLDPIAKAALDEERLRATLKPPPETAGDKREATDKTPGSQFLNLWQGIDRRRTIAEDIERLDLTGMQYDKGAVSDDGGGTGRSKNRSYRNV